MESVPIGDPERLLMAADVIRSTLSCLAFLRGIFPEVCFDDSVIEFDECQSQSQSSQGKTIRLKALLQNQSKATDLYINWIENVIKVLNDGYLQSVALNIYDHNGHVLECFNQELTNKCLNLNITHGSDESTTTSLQEFSFSKTMKRFIGAIQVLPDPNESTPRLVEMKILHNSACPPNYKVYDFATTRHKLSGIQQPLKNTPGQQELRNGTDEPKETKSRTSCECGTYNPDPKELIKCSQCGYYVHSTCYGFLRKYSLLQIKCFSCLHSTEPELLEAARTIILLRRVAKLKPPRKAKKPCSTQSISNSLGLPLRASSLLHGKLKEMGYYTPQPQGRQAYTKSIASLLFANCPKSSNNHPYSSIEPSFIQQLKNTGVFEINYRNDVDSISV